MPSDGVAAKDRPTPPRYLVSRVSPKQGRLFADCSEVKHFAIVTNRADPAGGDGLDLIRCQRGNAGTVEHAHRVLKDELAAAALPRQRFGANAAWFRLNVLLYNLLSAFKRVALPPELHDAKPQAIALRAPERHRQGRASRGRDRAPAGRRRPPPARRRRPTGTGHRPTRRRHRLIPQPFEHPGPAISVPEALVRPKTALKSRISRTPPLFTTPAPSPRHHRPRPTSPAPSSTPRSDYPGIWGTQGNRTRDLLSLFM